jgi:hypothetical protein
MRSVRRSGHLSQICRRWRRARTNVDRFLVPKSLPDDPKISPQVLDARVWSMVDALGVSGSLDRESDLVDGLGVLVEEPSKKLEVRGRIIGLAVKLAWSGGRS